MISERGRVVMYNFSTDEIHDIKNSLLGISLVLDILKRHPETLSEHIDLLSNEIFTLNAKISQQPQIPG